MTNEININLPYSTFQRIIPHYVRECLHRGGESAAICAQDVKTFWHYLGSEVRHDIASEIQFFIEEYHPLRNDNQFVKDLVIWAKLADWIGKNRHQPKRFCYL